MVNKKLKLGFIGGGINSAVGYAHKSASQLDGRYELVAGCFSRENSTNRATAEQWGVKPEYLYSDAESLLSSAKSFLEVVAILTPTPNHHELVNMALRSGIAVICEKSLSNSSQNIQSIIETEKHTNNHVMVTYNYSGYPIIRALQELIETGFFGRLFQINIEMPQDGFICNNKDLHAKIQPWRLEKTTPPVISLDLGIHLYHLVGFLTGQYPIEVLAKEKAMNNPDGIIDNISGLAEYSDGLSCQIWYSKVAFGYRNGLKLQVFGEKGSAEWIQTSPEELKLTGQDGRIQIMDRNFFPLCQESRYNRFKVGHPAGFIEAFANLYYDMADMILHHSLSTSISHPYVYGSQHSYEGLCFLEAMSRSSISRSWERVKTNRDMQ